MSWADRLEWLGAVIGGVAGWFLGGYDGLISGLFVLTLADYVSGMIKAWVRKELSSEIGFNGICRKVYIFILVGATNIIDHQIMPGGSDVLRDAVIFYYAINELVSLIENAEQIGLPMPKFLTDRLAAHIQDSHSPKLKKKKKK
ncbi:MAG: phage holin family protein [Firmicutes bacterium]|nr:phage holin family protein [Bacillota bacterium]